MPPLRVELRGLKCPLAHEGADWMAPMVSKPGVGEGQRTVFDGPPFATVRRKLTNIRAMGAT